MLARTLVPFALLALPSVAGAQRLLSSYALPSGHSIRTVRSAGDTNGDGEQDFVVLTRHSTPFANVISVVIVSGETGVPLHTLPQNGLQNEIDAIGIGDVNGDGRSDVLLVAYSLLRVFNGATGQVIASLPGQDYRSACAVGDFDGNGTGDIAVSQYSGTGGCTVRVLRGNNLTIVATVPGLSIQVGDVRVRSVGDLTSDGKPEVACCAEADNVLQVRDLVTGATLWFGSPTGSDSGRSIETLDLDGDGKREVFYFRPNLSAPGVQGSFTVYEPVNGTPLFTRSATLGTSFATSVAGLGDLDQDGTQEFVHAQYTSPGARLECHSGSGLWRRWSLSNWPGALGVDWVAALGDVDDDGDGDFAVRRYDNPSDGWAVISGRILAESQPQTGACGAGPFYPQLGASRPILGQTLTIAGQFAPAGAPGILACSLQPAGPTWLGASTCTAWFDLGGAFALATPSTPSWSFALPLPLVPQLAGFEIALQAWWAPTNGPLGYDLSNGVWARLGYQ
jgi:hypothetical protein